MTTIRICPDQIDAKYAASVAEVTANLKEFWSKRNVEMLSGFYQKWASDLARHQMNAMRVIHLFFQTVDQLFEVQDDSGKCLVEDKKKDGIYAKLLTRRELLRQVDHLRTQLVHQTAMDVFKYSRSSTDLVERDEQIASSYKFLNNSPNRVIEGAVHFGEIDLLTKEKIADLNDKITALIDQVQVSSPIVNQARSVLNDIEESSFTAEQKIPHPLSIQILEILKSVDPSCPNLKTLTELLEKTSLSLEIIKEIKLELTRIESYLYIKNLTSSLCKPTTLRSLYEEKIALIKTKNLSCMNEYIHWIRTLQFFKQEAQKGLRITLPESQRALELQQYIEEVAQEENRVHSLAHSENLEYASFYEPLNALSKVEAKALFSKELNDNEVLLFDVNYNKFISADLSKEIFAPEEVLQSLEQIEKLIYLLSHNNANAIAIVKSAYKKEDFTIAKVIKILLRKINHIENVYYKEDSKKPGIAKKIDQQIQALIQNQIKAAFDLAKEKSRLGKILQIDPFFAKGTPAHFYLKLAKDLSIIASVIPEKVPDDLIFQLAGNVDKEDAFVEENFLQALASDEAQKEALAHYIAIRNIDRKVRINPVLRIHSEKERMSYKNRFNKIFTEKALPAIEHLVDLIQSSKRAEEELICRLGRAAMAGPLKSLDEEAQTIFNSFSVENFHRDFPQALFYLDLALRIDSFDTPISHQKELFDSLEKKLFHKIVSYYRLHIQRNILATQNLTPLHQCVSSVKEGLRMQRNEDPALLMRHSAVISEIESLQNVGKLKNKFTEILLHGLRTYHSMFGSLTTFLDWREEDLKAEFVNHLLKKMMVRQQRLTKAPTKVAFDLYKKSLGSIPEHILQRAEELKSEFCSYLEYYRSIQREHYKFYTALGNILIRNQSILDLPEVTIEDIELLEQNIDSIQIGFFNDMDQKVAQNLRPHLESLKELFRRTPKNEQAKAFYDFIAPLMTENQIPFMYDQVSYLNFKLLIRTIRIIQAGKKIKGINVDEFRNLFIAPKSFWKQFAEQTQIATSLFIERQLDAFISEKEELEKFRFFTDLRPSREAGQSHLWEYFSLSPVRMTIASINTLSKWNSYRDDLQKRIKGTIIKDCLSAISSASFQMNEDLGMRASVQERRKTMILKTKAS